MTETVVGRLADFPEGSHRVVEVGGREIGVFNVGGRFYGLPNRCPHQAGPLCEGRTTTGTLVADAASGWRPRWVMDGEVDRLPVARARVPRADGALPRLPRDPAPPLRGRRPWGGGGGGGGGGGAAAARRQPRIQPPSTSSVCPVTNPLSSPAKKATAARHVLHLAPTLERLLLQHAAPERVLVGVNRGRRRRERARRGGVDADALQAPRGRASA